MHYITSISFNNTKPWLRTHNLRAEKKPTKFQSSALVKSMSTSDDDMIPMKEFKHIEVPIIKIVTNDSSNDISNIPIITLTEPEPDDYGKFRFFMKGTIHLRRRQIFTIIYPYPPL